MLGELADIHFKAERITEKPTEAMHDDDLERAVVIAGALDHPLKLGPVVVHGGSAGSTYSEMICQLWRSQ